MENFEINQENTDIKNEYLPIRNIVETFESLKRTDPEKAKYFLNNTLNFLASSREDELKNKHELVLRFFEEQYD